MPKCLKVDRNPYDTINLSFSWGRCYGNEMVNTDREVTVWPSYFSLTYFINKWCFSRNNKDSKIDKLPMESRELLDQYCNSSNIK